MMSNLFLRVRPVVIKIFTFVPVRTVTKGPKGKSKQLLIQKAKMRERERQLQKRKHLLEEAQKEKEFAAAKMAIIGEPLDPELLNPARKRSPPVISEEEQVRRTLLMKQWTRELMSQHKKQLQQLQLMLNCRDKAMRELRKVSLTLYEQAMEPEPALLTFTSTGPTETPPLTNYLPPEEATST